MIGLPQGPSDPQRSRKEQGTSPLWAYSDLLHQNSEGGGGGWGTGVDPAFEILLDAWF